jgi:hypothetical protein
VERAWRVSHTILVYATYTVRYWIGRAVDGSREGLRLKDARDVLDMRDEFERRRRRGGRLAVSSSMLSHWTPAEP